MICNWPITCPKVPLTELLSFIVDNRGKTVPTTDTGIALIATNCVKNESLYPVFEKIRYLSNETYLNWFRAHPKSGDIIFVNKGTPGRVCMVPNPVNFCIAQDMIAFRADDSKIYNKYLFAVLRSDQIQKKIYNTNVGDVIPHFKKSFLDELLIPLPSMNIQRAIGDFYFNLSSKIELNNRINKTLEEMAQAIYKSWVVDEGERRNTIELGEVIETTSGGTPSRTKDDYYKNGTINWVKSKELNSSFIIDTEEKITTTALAESSAKLLPKHSVLVAMYGATVGEYGIISEEMTCNQAVCALKPNDNYPYTYLFMLIKGMRETLVNMAVGSAQQNISQLLIKQLPVNDCISQIKRYHDLVNPTFLQIENNTKENLKLAQLRDTLLPKLMSGEIRVPVEVE